MENVVELRNVGKYIIEMIGENNQTPFQIVILNEYGEKTHNKLYFDEDEAYKEFNITYENLLTEQILDKI